MTKTIQLGLLGAVLCCSTALVGAQTVHITEIRIDHPGGDINEYFELAGDPGESLDGLTYIVIGDGGQGNDGVIEAVVDLAGFFINASGRFLVVEANFDLGPPVPDLTLPGNGLNFENSDNVTHLLVEGFTGTTGDDLDFGGPCVADEDCLEGALCIDSDGDEIDDRCNDDFDGELDIMPWTSVIDLIALIEEENPPVATEFHYGPPTVGPDGPFVPGHAYLCEPSGIWLIGGFTAGTDDTPGTANPDCACGDAGTGNCFDAEGTGTPFCEDGACCQDICDDHDATCCTDEWDDVCAGLATDFCLKGGKPPVVSISEIRTGQGGSDTDEYFELTADFDTLLDGVSYIVIGDGVGGSGVIEHITDLGGNQFFSNFFVAAEESFTIGIADIEVPLNFEDSDNVTHMLVWNFTGEDNQDLDIDDDGVLDFEPWQQIIDSVAIIGDNVPCVDEICIYSANVVGPDGIFTPGHVYKCDPTQEWTVGEFIVEDACAVDTPQAVNQNCELVCPCGSENAGSCFEVNDNANCDDADCCDLIISDFDATCADDWVQNCVDLALIECSSCGAENAGNCLEVNGTPYCNDQACCDQVCAIDATCCLLPDGWDAGCVALAQDCDIPDPVEPGDLVFGLGNPDEFLTLELIRGPGSEDGGMVVTDSWEEPWLDSVEFDNLNGIAHNNRGNLLGVNFGPSETLGGTIHSLATCAATSTDQFIGDTLGEGGKGLTPTRLASLSVSPDNTKIAVIGVDSLEVIVYDYTAGDCFGAGASLSNARETSGHILCDTIDAQGTAWLDNDTVLVFNTNGEIRSVDANTMASNVVATVTVVGPETCDGSFTSLEYNPDISPNVYAMHGDFVPAKNSSTNLLFVLDPTDPTEFNLLGTFDYSSSLEDTSTEIAFDADGNLYVGQFGGSIDVIVDAANLASLEGGNNSLNWYTSPTFSPNNGLDVAIGQIGPPPACSPSSGDCCDTDGNGTPGCNDDECCNLVCDTAGFESCCDAEWTTACAAEAQEVCSDGVCCGDCPWDIDDSGTVTALDLGNLLGCWSTPGPPGPCPPLSGVCPCFDSDGDGCISAIDLGSLLGAWGPC